MGIYINPKDNTSKRLFLREKGIETTVEEIKSLNNLYDDVFPIVLIDSVYFESALVVTTPRELDEIVGNSDDLRIRTYFLLSSSEFEGNMYTRDYEYFRRLKTS